MSEQEMTTAEPEGARRFVLGRPLIIALAIVLLLAGFLWVSFGSSASDRGSITIVDNEGLRALVADGARLVDVRTPSEYEAGHIPGAELVPTDSLAAAAQDWDRSRPVVVYCATGARSAEAAGVLADLGFEVYDLSTGVARWDGELTTETVPAGSGASGGSTRPVLYEFSSDT